jgi:photosystem II stability/assembly factor-like uncharacterized protein
MIVLGAMAVAAMTAHSQWTLQNSNSTASLRGIHSLGGGVAWASGTNGTVLRTEDGGYLWQACTIPPGAEKLDFRGIQAFNANAAIVMSSGKGDLSRLYKTTDGCHSWKLLFTNPDKDGFWDAIQFNRAQWGWILGDPVKGRFVLFATHDKGHTWIKQQNKGLNADPNTQGAFAASNSSLAAIGGYMKFASGGTGGAFVYSMVETTICLDACSDADMDYEGRKDKWSVQSIPVGNKSQGAGVFSLVRRHEQNAPNESQDTVIAVGGDYTQADKSDNTAAWSSDDGGHWAVSTSPPHGYRSAVAYDAATKTWITVGPNGTDMSTDDGKNWRAVKPNPTLNEPADADKNWNALSLPFVVGPHGRIGRLNEAALKSALSAK